MHEFTQPEPNEVKYQLLRLTGNENGFIKSDPVAVSRLLNNAFTKGRVDIANPDNRSKDQVYRRLLSILSSCGVTTITKDIVRNEGFERVYDKFSSVAVIDLGFIEDPNSIGIGANTTVQVKAEGPVDPEITREVAQGFNLGFISAVGKPSLKVEYKSVYPDGTDDTKVFEFGAHGQNEFQHWKRDREWGGFDSLDGTEEWNCFNL